jgi:hypothetical protein
LRLRQNNRKRIEKHKSNKMKRRKRKIDKVFEWTSVHSNRLSFAFERNFFGISTLWSSSPPLLVIPLFWFCPKNFVCVYTEGWYDNAPRKENSLTFVEKKQKRQIRHFLFLPLCYWKFLFVWDKIYLPLLFSMKWNFCRYNISFAAVLKTKSIF